MLERRCLNPLKRVNSILTRIIGRKWVVIPEWSQSPQTGQFNSYLSLDSEVAFAEARVSIPSNGSIQFLHSWDPNRKVTKSLSLNPLKRVNSILTRFEIWVPEEMKSLNPLKRVNSILTPSNDSDEFFGLLASQSPQTGQFNSYYIFPKEIDTLVIVSIPSNGSIQFLLVFGLMEQK